MHSSVIHKYAYAAKLFKYVFIWKEKKQSLWKATWSQDWIVI